MPATASLAPKPLAAKPKSAPPAHKADVSPVAAKTAAIHPGPPALPAFAREPVSVSPPVTSKPVTSISPKESSSETLGPPRKSVKPAPVIPIRQEISPNAHPIPAPMQDALESSLGMDFGGVQVHTDSHAQSAAKAFSARAFTYGNHIYLGQDEKISDLRLMAHEAAHVVQQQHVPTIHRSAAGQNDAYEREADRASSAVVRGEKFTVRESVTNPRVQRWGLGDALDYFADKANLIPGFRMFTVVLGVNPVNMSPVERSAANILRAAVEIIPGMALITKVLDKYGVFEKVGTWVEQQIKTLGLIGSSIKKSIDEFLHSLHWSDVLRPENVWERAKRIFTDPIDRIKNLLSEMLDGIIDFVKKAILLPLAKLAEKTAGWDLLIAVLGKNPITGEPVERNADTLIGGFMKLIGKEEIWNNIKKANAAARAWVWFQKALSDLHGFVNEIPSLFLQALKALEWTDILELPAAFIKVGKAFGNFIGRFFSWAGDAAWSLLQIIFEVVVPGAIPYLKKVGAAFRSILENPIGFVGNLVKAGKLGFEQFADNFGAHLKASFLEWLTGAMTGVYIPQSLELREIVKFILSALGLTWQNIRGKLVKVLGETTVKAMEIGFDIVVTLVKEGPAAAWEKIKEELSNLKDMVVQGIMNFIVETVVKKAVAKVVALLVPGGAFVQAIISIYDTIMVFVDKLAKIVQVVTAFLDSMMDIVHGAITGAAKKVESTLAGMLTLAISFLAGFLGLGKIADKVLAIIQKVRDSVDKALDKVVDWVVTMAKKLWSAAKSGVAKLTEWWKAKVSVKAGKEAHEIYFKGEQAEAEVIFASTPMPLEEFLNDREKKAKGDQKDLIAGIKKQLAGIKSLIKQSKPGEQDEKLQKQIEDAMNELGKDLAGLLTGKGWGSEANPAPLNYEKRRSASYPIFYLSIGTSKELDQDVLKDLYGKGKAQRYMPNVQDQEVQGESERLGLGEDSQIDVGRKIEFEEKGSRDSGVTKFKGLVNRHGLTPSAQGWDVDHVVELQIGGRDEFSNLWPLPSGENRSSGSIIKNAETSDADGEKLSVKDAYAKRQKDGEKSLWLIVTSTRQR
jgi:hypothetical protein